MGGRGASSGWSLDKYGNKLHKYGTEYRSVLTVGNIKFVVQNAEGSVKAPKETMTRGRVYVTLNAEQTKPQYITYYDNDNKKVKSIDLLHYHRGEMPHTHHGYEHSENDSAKGSASLTPEEKKMVDRVNKIWDNYLKGNVV